MKISYRIRPDFSGYLFDCIYQIGELSQATKIVQIKYKKNQHSTYLSLGGGHCDKTSAKFLV